MTNANLSVSSANAAISVGTAAAFIEQIREYRDANSSKDTRAAVEALIANSAPSAWLWVYELVQNAIDAGAHRVRILEAGDGVRFEHDGDEPLTETHVEALCGLGRSTKGLTTVGFMGVGFKSVFHRFQSANVSANHWRFRFNIGEDEGALGARVPRWFDALRPSWDDSLDAPQDGFTTRFDLGRPWSGGDDWRADLQHIADPRDPTSLAVVALRGLESLEAASRTWNLNDDRDSQIVTVSPSDGKPRRWLALRCPYRPGPAALRRFIEVRRNLRADVVNDDKVVNREVVGLVPLGDDGVPVERKLGLAYATLPTQEPVPFAIDIQADWLVDLARRGLREVENDAWQKEIVAQIPLLVSKYVEWARRSPREHAGRALAVLAAPDADDLAQLSRTFRDETFVGSLRNALAQSAFVPVIASGQPGYSTPQHAHFLPHAFEEPFAVDPLIRGDLVFGAPIIDAQSVQLRARQFLEWLGWCAEVAPGDVDWPKALEEWQAALPYDERDPAVMLLWGCLSKANGWDALRSVRTAAETWIAPSDLRRLGEAEPTVDQPGGEAVRRALGSRIPRPDQLLPGTLRNRIDTSSQASIKVQDAARWIRRHEQVKSLADAIHESYAELAHPTVQDEDAFIGLPMWAMSRGMQRTDLVPLVLTSERECRPPRAVLLACAGVPGADARRQLFSDVPVVDRRYLDSASDSAALIDFLSRLGLQGGLRLREKTQHQPSARGDAVAQLLGVPRDAISPANASGYLIRDQDWEVNIETVPAAALSDWLEAEQRALAGAGRKQASWQMYNHYNVRGESRCAWVERLEKHDWVACSDGKRRAPISVLMEPMEDYPDAPIANLSGTLVRALRDEGVRWGSNVPKAPVLHRLQSTAKRSAEEIAQIIVEAATWVDGHPEDRLELLKILPGVEIDGRPLTRWVRAVGSAGTSRSALDGWVEALPTVLAESLGRVHGYTIAETTTGHMALSFLRHVWISAAAGKEVKIERRRVIPLAYRYVVADDEAMTELKALAADSPQSVLLFSRERWHSISEKPVIDDIADERIAMLLATNRPLVRASHLADDPGELAALARLLGVQRLSKLVEGHVDLGVSIASPGFDSSLELVLRLLSRDSHVPPTRALRWVESIAVQLENNRIELGAWLDESSDTLYLVSNASRMSQDLATLLITRHGLSQRGHACAMLSLALDSVERTEAFMQVLRRLARALNIEESEAESDGGSKGQSTEVAFSHGDAKTSSESSNDQSVTDQASGSSDNSSGAAAALPIEFDGKRFASVGAAIEALAPVVNDLALGPPVTAEAVAAPSNRVAHQPSAQGGPGTGGGIFSPKASILGRLGEIYGQRWLRESSRLSKVEVIDVSTREARSAATYPGYYKPADLTVSPGCDVLVFEKEGDLPIGYEVKSRRDSGAIQFEWTRREEEACRNVRDGVPDPHWPLKDYRILIISDLLVPHVTPSVAILSADECLKGAEATGWVVRALTQA